MYTIIVLMISDKRYAKEREDMSGREIVTIMERRGDTVAYYGILSYEEALISAELRQSCNGRLAWLHHIMQYFKGLFRHYSNIMVGYDIVASSLS